MGVRRCPDTTVQMRIFWNQFYVADLSVKNHEMGNKGDGTAAVTSKANSHNIKAVRQVELTAHMNRHPHSPAGEKLLNPACRQQRTT